MYNIIFIRINSFSRAIRNVKAEKELKDDLLKLNSHLQIGEIILKL